MWLGMNMYGRWQGYGEDDVQLYWHKRVIRKMVEIYLETESVPKFIEELRVRDLQIELEG